MGFFSKLFGRFLGGKGAAAGAAGAPRPVTARQVAQKLCESCGRRRVGDQPCPFCQPQHFGEELQEGTVSTDYKPQKGVATMAGVVVAHAAAQEHGAKAFLHVFQGKNKGATVLIADRPVTIGRGQEGTTLMLNDGGVSTKHCEVKLTPQGLMLTDTGSKNGVYVNDERVKERLLQNGDSLGIGETRLYVGVVG